MLSGKCRIWGIAVSGLALMALANPGDAFAKDKVKIAFVGPLTGATPSMASADAIPQNSPSS